MTDRRLLSRRPHTVTFSAARVERFASDYKKAIAAVVDARYTKRHSAAWLVADAAWNRYVTACLLPAVAVWRAQ